MLVFHFILLVVSQKGLICLSCKNRPGDWLSG